MIICAVSVPAGCIHVQNKVPTLISACLEATRAAVPRARGC